MTIGRVTVVGSARWRAGASAIGTGPLPGRRGRAVAPEDVVTET